MRIAKKGVFKIMILFPKNEQSRGERALNDELCWVTLWRLWELKCNEHLCCGMLFVCYFVFVTQQPWTGCVIPCFLTESRCQNRACRGEKGGAVQCGTWRARKAMHMEVRMQGLVINVGWAIISHGTHRGLESNGPSFTPNSLLNSSYLG